MMYIYFHLKIFKKFKVCLCTIGKKENLYIKEFVEYYKQLGLDKIFIYDNNDKEDEKFDLLLKDYIDEGLVKIIDIRGKVGPQIMAMEDCKNNNFKIYDWLMFFDIDEFIYLRNFSNIKDFLDRKIFDKCQRIHLNWFVHTDNNQVYFHNRTLKERFPEKKVKLNGKYLGGATLVKSILKGNIITKIKDSHGLNPNLTGCNGFGEIKQLQGTRTNETDHYYYYIDHYWSKSTEEFTDKLLKGDVILGYNNKQNNLNRIKMYFSYNDITEEKINYIENRTKYNLTEYRLLIKK